MFSINYKDFLGILFLFLYFSCTVSGLFTEVAPHLESARHQDGRFLYVAGACWLSNRSPYHSESFREIWTEKIKCQQFQTDSWKGEENRVFTYMPPIAILLIPVALFDWCGGEGKLALDLINVFSLVLVLFFSGAILKRSLNLLSFGKMGFALGLGCLVSSVQIAMITGQTSLIVLMGCLGAFYFSQRKNFFIAAVFIVIASIKPTFSLLPIIYLFLQTKSWRLFGWSSILVGFTNVSFLLLGGGSPQDFLHSLVLYKGMSVNSPDRLSGLHTIMAHMGIFNEQIISLIVPSIGIILVATFALLYFKRLSFQLS